MSGRTQQAERIRSYVHVVTTEYKDNMADTLNDAQLKFYNKTGKKLRNAMTGFDELSVSVPTDILNIPSTYGQSDLRDVETVTGSGSVSNANGYYTVATGATGSSTATLDTAKLGRYIAGFEATPGLDVCVPTLPTGEQVARWGYFNDNDGFGTGVDVDGLFTFIRRGGNERVHREDNGDWATTFSDVNIDVTNHNIYRYPFRWYGGGPVKYEVSIVEDRIYPSLARYDLFEAEEGELITETANLPVRVEVENGSTTSNFEVRVAGRQFFVNGSYNPPERLSSEYRLGQTISSAGFTPIITFKQKETGGLSEVSSQLASVIMGVATNDVVWQVRLNATVDTPTADLSDIPNTETSFLVDKTYSTAITDGHKIAEGLVTAGQGARKVAGKNDLPSIEIPAGSLITLCAIADGADATASTVFQLEEQW